MTEWVIHPVAQEEHDRLLEHFGSIDAELMVAFELCYLRQRRFICENPHSYSIRGKAVRRANLGPRFGEYYIAYKVWKQTVVILAVAHARRRPYYWKERIGGAKELL